MLQINPFLDCTVYSGIVVHIGRNSHKGVNMAVLGVNITEISRLLLKSRNVFFSNLSRRTNRVGWKVCQLVTN
jgi:hypothetical protein